MTAKAIWSKEAKMTALALSFPSGDSMDGVSPWDALAVLRWLCTGGGSHGERATAQFLLSVWNPSTDWVEIARDNDIQNPEGAGRFDLHDAMGVWDRNHRKVFVAWAQDPWWP